MDKLPPELAPVVDPIPEDSPIPVAMPVLVAPEPSPILVAPEPSPILVVPEPSPTLLAEENKLLPKPWLPPPEVVVSAKMFVDGVLVVVGSNEGVLVLVKANVSAERVAGKETGKAKDGLAIAEPTIIENIIKLLIR